jgi:transposase
MQKIKEIIGLYQAEYSIRKISKLTSISRTAVNTAVNWFKNSSITFQSILKIPDDKLDRMVYPIKEIPSNKQQQFESRKKTILADISKKHMTLEVLWYDFIREFPDGYKYSQFCYHVNRARKKNNQGSLPMNHVYGEMMYVDFAGDVFKFNTISGLEYKLKLFVAILPASRYTFASFKKTEKTKDWITGSREALEYYGGAPKGIGPDCAKAVVKKADRHEPEINPQYGQFANHYNSVIVPARPYSPKDKALVENAVNNLYRFVYPRMMGEQFLNLEDAEKKLANLIDQFNNRIMKDHGSSRKELFEKYERQELTPLPSTPFEYRTYQPPRKIGTTQHIYLKEDANYYSVPERYIGQKCELYYTDKCVEVYCNDERVATHQRTMQAGYYTTDNNHLALRLRRFMEYNEESLVTRASEVGIFTEKIMKKIFELQAHPLQARKSAYGLIGLLKKYKKEKLELACKKSFNSDVYRMKKIQQILEKGLEKVDEQLFFPNLLHKNLRY